MHRLKQRKFLLIGGFLAAMAAFAIVLTIGSATPDVATATTPGQQSIIVTNDVAGATKANGLKLDFATPVTVPKLVANAPGCAAPTVALVAGSDSKVLVTWPTICVNKGESVTVGVTSGTKPVQLLKVEWLNGTTVLPSQTPTPKPTGTGNLSGIFDILVHPVAAKTVGLFHCIARQDHYPDNTGKLAAVCYADTNQEAPGGAIPSTDKTEPNYGPNILPGPNPPPPYEGQGNGKGNFIYSKGTDTLTSTTCFNVGGALGPNTIAVVTVPNAKAQLSVNSTMQGTVLVYDVQSNADCANKAPKGPTPAALGVTFYRVADLNKVPDLDGITKSWRTTAKLPGAPIDFDGDLCNDQDELDKNRAVKPCGDNPYNPYDSDENFDSVFSISVEVVAADACQGQKPTGLPPVGCTGAADHTIAGGSYFNCIADIQHNKTTNALLATAYCLSDNPVTTVNIQDTPGKNQVTCAPFGPANPNKCGDGLSGQPPNSLTALGDVDSPHTTLTGIYNKTTNRLELSGCFNGVENPTQGPSVWAEVTADAHTGEGTVDIWLNQPNNCTTHATLQPSTKDAGVSLTECQPKSDVLKKNCDTDLDGCSDKAELQSAAGSEVTGGRRDPMNPWDFYDTDNNQVVDLFIDIFGVAGQFGSTAQLPKLDRGAPLNGSKGAWNIHGPDKTIDLFNDIFGVANQFGHDCSQP
ncbi:MAG: flexitail domain-containing putative surface protein [Dehalococcoidia bacterium]|nr:flexitail domain-containing putative surface protein [Dehalococcoidia bacterium]